METQEAIPRVLVLFDPERITVCGVISDRVQEGRCMLGLLKKEEWIRNGVPPSVTQKLLLAHTRPDGSSTKLQGSLFGLSVNTKEAMGVFKHSGDLGNVSAYSRWT